VTRAVVVTTWFPDRAHPSRTPFCLEHVKAVQLAGVEASVIHVELGARGPVVRETFDGVRVTRAPMPRLNPLQWIRTLRLMRTGMQEADVLHTMAFSSVLVAALPWLSQRLPWAHTEHWNGVVNPASVGGWWPRVSSLRHVLRLPHAVTGVTQELTDDMARFTRRDATSVLPCVVHTPGAVPPFPPPRPLRLVGVGLLIDRKNPLLAIETIAWLRDQGVDVRYEWIGDGPLRQSMLDKIQELDLEDVVSLAGAVDPARVQMMVAESHLFFVPSAQENFFTAVAEAIAVGRPAVVPRSGGFVEYCTPDNSEIASGWTVEDLGEAVLRASARFRTASPTEVSATVSARFSPDQVAHLIRVMYTQAVQSHG